MAKVSVELEDSMFTRLVEIAAARNTTVEELIRTQAESVADLAYDDIPNPSHRAIMAVLDRPDDYYDSKREQAHDRELARAENYAEYRQRLLALIDATEGDLGAQTWHRASLYDR